METVIKRPLCHRCQRPLQRCYCPFVVDCGNRLPVVIWQHPTETDHPKGTAPLLAACLQRCITLINETMSAEEFHRTTGFQAPLLLFPADSNTHNPQTSMGDTQGARSDCLLVLDGTWRKTRKLVYMNPWLMELRRLSLSLNHRSGRYRIRKAERNEQLSTFEATVEALYQLEPDSTPLASLHDSFGQYMCRLMLHRPARE